MSFIAYKKRKSDEERATENIGRRVIRYSPKGGKKVVGVWQNMSVQEIADVLEKDVDHVFKTLAFADKESDTEYKENTVIRNFHIIRDVVKISGYRFKIVAPPDREVKEEVNKDAVPQPPAAPEALKPRPPVVCVMGHVDHGKTTLLDALRDTRVVDQEFGGITQHIGAFEAMRSRGAHATDVVVLVVAADDGVMEQTVESIRMAKEASVHLAVEPDSNSSPILSFHSIQRLGPILVERTMKSLAQHNVICEAMGGDVQAVPISALKKLNLDLLVEALILQAHIMDLKSDPDGYVEGVVMEALVHPNFGKQATVLVQRGTLRKGDVLVAGLGWAKVRALYSADGKPLESAPPSTPVSVIGWRELPSAGDQVLQVSNEKRAGEVMRWRSAERMKEKQEADLEVIHEKTEMERAAYKAQLAKKRAMGRLRLKPEGPRQKMIQEDLHPTLNILVKGDVDGSVEAILDILDTYNEHEVVRLDLVNFGVGQVTPNDIEIAEAFNAVIYAFNVECPPVLAVEAKNKGLLVKKHNVIYKLVSDVKEEINIRIPKKQEEEVIGEANALQQFMVSEGRKKVPVAGCRCLKGTLNKHALYRIVRGAQVVYEGKLASMKHLKDEVDTIKRDMECGLRFADPTFEVQPGDTIICYKLVDVSVVTKWDPGF
ncbi:Translation initiation factor IF-2, mitochondrial [Eumeta japonica]|uniref:Translation initiation factor IF-2, mitochondrial n=1 Tax=Eumeta variegata TaxID=151549 RepID=A0A4C1U8V2_EUMVA|nr:Translation initiation factor IF-2, mitochondrial [Eumeta japonica]